MNFSQVLFLYVAPGHNDYWFLQQRNTWLENKLRIVRQIIITTRSRFAKEPSQHKMTNTSNKINDKQIRIAKKQIIDKQIRIARKQEPSQSYKKVRRAVSHRPSTRKWSNKPSKSASWSERRITVARKQPSVESGTYGLPNTRCTNDEVTNVYHV